MKDNLRILCLGVGRDDDKRYDYATPKKLAPTIFDYDIVILDISSIISRGFFIKEEQFQRLFDNEGICFVISDKNKFETSQEGIINRYDWFPFSHLLEVQDVSGKSVIWTNKEAKLLFDSISFRWNCYFSSIPKDSMVLAENRVGDAISFVTPCESGYCIFLPNPMWQDEDRFFNLLLENGLSLISELRNSSVAIPKWINKYATELERRLLKEKMNIDEKLGRTGKIKPLLYETGTRLENLVIEALKEMGLDVKRLTEESYADFEFSISDDLTGICEVKGLREAANIRHLRQLLQYYIEQKDIEKRNVKGIFIVNHFKDEEPEERGKPLTKDALELVGKHNFIVITTVELYHLIMEFLDNKLSKKEFLSRFV